MIAQFVVMIPKNLLTSVFCVIQESSTPPMTRKKEAIVLLTASQPEPSPTKILATHVWALALKTSEGVPRKGGSVMSSANRRKVTVVAVTFIYIMTPAFVPNLTQEIVTMMKMMKCVKKVCSNYLIDIRPK